MAGSGYGSESYQRNSVFAFVVYLIVLVLGIFLALLAGGALENEDNLKKLSLYAVPLILITLAVVFDKLLYRESDFTFVHDPQKGVLSRFLPSVLNRPLIVFFLTFLIFSPIIFYSVILQNSSFVSFEKYQILESAQIFMSAEPASTSESLILMITVGLGYLLSFRVAGKNFLLMVIMLLGVALFAGSLLTSYHLVRYGANETALLSVFIFFTMSSLLLVLFGSIIVVIVPHTLNNALLEMKSLLSNELVYVFAITFYLVVLIIFGFYFYSTLVRRRSYG